MKLASALLLTFAPAAFLYGQTPAAKKPVVHHAAAATAATASTAESALPPSIPKVAGVPKTLFSLKYIDTLVGTGPLAEQTVLGTSMADSKVMWYTVRYTGWVAKDGSKFDSTDDHPGAEPLTIPVGVHAVITGWDLAFAGMHIGGKRRVFIPSQLAYGVAGKAPGIPPNADLIFDIELVSATDKRPTPPAPPQGQAPPNPAAQPATPPPAQQPVVPPPVK